MNKHCACGKRIVSAVLALAITAPMLPAGGGFARAAETVPSAGAEELLTQEDSCEKLDQLRYYDDRMDVSGCEVEIVDAGVPISYQVGYGVAENAVQDSAVLTLEDGTLVASGTGRACILQWPES